MQAAWLEGHGCRASMEGGVRAPGGQGRCPAPTVSQGPNFLENGVGLDWHEVRWGDKA